MYGQPGPPPAPAAASGGGRPGSGLAGREGARMAPGGVAGKTGYAPSCVLAALVLVLSGVCYCLVGAVGGIGGSHAITGGPSVGAQNILLMGLESRRDWNGNILPASILNHLHAASVQR